MSEQTFTLVGSVGIMIIIIVSLFSLLWIGFKGSKKNNHEDTNDFDVMANKKLS
ncbi:hypothetical protein [Massilibacterium senegalense]|uniref:hypothetical protein n=1 Tax=Massilibacterium senegalense TaxID=1632858 RepID=UPI0012B5A6E1|nr:hypothetical protein [Massilibacterium senegalense]